LTGKGNENILIDFQVLRIRRKTKTERNKERENYSEGQNARCHSKTGNISVQYSNG
jgi:hypothetical protein